jgi:predicted dehydrogenase
VRWTEKRNFSAVLGAIATKKLDVQSLITDRVDLIDFERVYGNIGSSKSIATILKYDLADDNTLDRTIKIDCKQYDSNSCEIGIIGAGNFTKMTMLPALKKANATIKTIASSGGLSGTTLAKKFGIPRSTTSTAEIFSDKSISSVLIATRHNSHAKFIIEALKHNKHVFVEKPMALSIEDLNKIIQVEGESTGSVTVGFNRRFSPHIQAIKKSLGSFPMNIVATMNAGFIPESVWVHDMEVGGGRIIGEACHYFDVCVYLTGSLIESVCMQAMGNNPQENTDNASILLKFQNGSTAVVNYFANGSKSYSKERLEIYSQERTIVVDNFRNTKGFGVKGFKSLKTKLNKGHDAQFESYVNFIKNGGKPIIEFRELVNVTKASFLAIESLKEGKWISV